MISTATFRPPIRGHLAGSMVGSTLLPLLPLLLLVLLLLPQGGMAAPTSVIVLNREKFIELVQDPQLFVLVHIFAPWSARSRELDVTFEQLPTVLSESTNLSAALLDRIVVAKLNGVKYESIARRYHVTTFPAVLLINGSPERFLAYRGEHFTAEDIGSFAAHAVIHPREVEFADQVARRLRSEARVPHPSPGAVTELTDDNFDMYALDTQRTVLVLFFSPWCSHCREVHPMLDEIAAFFQQQDEVLIAKVNGEKSPTVMQRLKVDAFPTLMAFPRFRVGKDGIVFSGRREAAHLLAFVDTMNRSGGGGGGGAAAAAAAVGGADDEKETASPVDPLDGTAHS